MIKEELIIRDILDVFIKHKVRLIDALRLLTLVSSCMIDLLNDQPDVLLAVAEEGKTKLKVTYKSKSINTKRKKK